MCLLLQVVRSILQQIQSVITTPKLQDRRPKAAPRHLNDDGEPSDFGLNVWSEEREGTKGQA